MATWIALLRGINVVGCKVVPMKALTVDLERQGLQGVRTYIQSGNVVFQCSRGTPNTLGQRIGKSYWTATGFSLECSW